MVYSRALPGPVGGVCIRPMGYTPRAYHSYQLSPSTTMSPHFSSGLTMFTLPHNEPTWRCHQNPFIGALGIQEPVIPGEPLIKG